MGGCRCSYKNCKSSTRTTEHLHFFHYPIKHRERCRKWIEQACNSNLFDLSEDQLRNKVVCELHFEEKCFTDKRSRRRLIHSAIPTLDAECQHERRKLQYRKNQTQTDEIQLLAANENGTIFTVQTYSLENQLVPEKVESYMYSNGTLVPVYAEYAADGSQNVVYTVYNESQQENKRVSNGAVVCEDSVEQTSTPKVNGLLFDTFTKSGGAESIAIDYEILDGIADSHTMERQTPHSITIEMDDENRSTKEDIKIASKKLQENEKVINDTVFLSSLEQTSAAKTYELFFDAFPRNKGAESITSDHETLNDSVNSHTKDRQTSNSINIEIKADEKRTTEQDTTAVDTEILKKVNQNSNQTLNSNLVHNPQKRKKVELGLLPLHLPPTLFGLVKRVVEKGMSSITDDELELFKEIYTASPVLYENLKKKYGWYLPEIQLVSET